jgi:hypothetical protein
VAVGADLYVGARNPERERWVAWVDRDPEVRLRIGTQLYEVRLEPLDTTRLEAVRGAYADEYGLSPGPGEAAVSFRYWRVLPRS